MLVWQLRGLEQARVGSAWGVVVELSPEEEGYRPLSGCGEHCVAISVGLSHPYIISLSCTLLDCLLGHTRKWPQDFFHPLLSLPCR